MATTDRVCMAAKGVSANATLGAVAAGAVLAGPGGAAAGGAASVIGEAIRDDEPSVCGPTLEQR